MSDARNRALIRQGIAPRGYAAVRLWDGYGGGGGFGGGRGDGVGP